MHRMNDQSGNAITQLFAWIAAFAAAVGFSTQDVVYMIFGLMGVLISFGTFICGRVDAHNEKKEREKRTALFEKYLEQIASMPPEQRSASIEIISETLHRMDAHAK